MLCAWITILIILTLFNAVTINKVGVASSAETVAPNTTHSPASEGLTTARINGTFSQTAEVSNAYCRIVPFDDYFMKFVMPIALGLLGYIIPGVAMLIMNVILHRGIRRAQQARSSMRNGHEDRSVGRGSSDTKMLLGISVLFILTNLPVSAHYVYYHYWTGNNHLKNIIYILMLNISYINNAFNFVIYCFRGQKFRAALRDLVSCNRERTGRNGRGADRRRNTRSDSRFTELTVLS